MKKFLSSIILALALVIALPTMAEAKTTVKISATKKTVYTGSSFTLSIKKNNKKVSGVKWTSGNKKLATVNSNGKVTIKKSTGRVNITGTYKKKKYTCKVTIKAKKSATIKLTKSSLQMNPNESETIYLQNGNSKVVCDKVVSANSNIASVKKNGKKIIITAKKAGTTTITAKYGNKNYKVKVIVKKWAQVRQLLQCYPTDKKTDKYVYLSLDQSTFKTINQKMSFTFTFDTNLDYDEINFTGGKYKDYDADNYNGVYDTYTPFDFKVVGNKVTITAEKIHIPTDKCNVEISFTVKGENKVGSHIYDRREYYASNIFSVKNTTKGSDWDTKHLYESDGITLAPVFQKQVIKEAAPGVHHKPADFGVVQWVAHDTGIVIPGYEIHLDLGDGKVTTIYGWYSKEDSEYLWNNVSIQQKALCAKNGYTYVERTMGTDEMYDLAIMDLAYKSVTGFTEGLLNVSSTVYTYRYNVPSYTWWTDEEKDYMSVAAVFHKYNMTTATSFTKLVSTADLEYVKDDAYYAAQVAEWGSDGGSLGEMLSVYVGDNPGISVFGVTAYEYGFTNDPHGHDISDIEFVHRMLNP